MASTKKTFCRICEPACPLQAEVNDADEVVELLPDPGHPLGGIPCNKGLTFLDVHNDPDRLNWPLKRTNDKLAEAAEFKRIDWDDAFAEIADKIRALQCEFGNDAVAVYAGNPLAFDSRAMQVIPQLATVLGTSMFFSAGTQDCTNKFVTAASMYGGNFNLIPDLTHTDYLLCLGANPKVSHWTSISVPNDGGKLLKDIKTRGGKVTFVNPRKIESSTAGTGETVQIRPDTDVYFLAALSNEIFKMGGFDQANLTRYGKNLEQYLDFVGQWTANKVEKVTGVSVAQIQQIASDMVAAKSAACYVSTGINQSRQGTLSCWLSEMLNFATGNLGKEGGTYKATQLGAPQAMPAVLHEWDSPYGSIPLGASMMPGVLLADLIERQQIRAIICLGGNPLLSMGGEEQLKDAFAKLDLLICLDIIPTLTTEYADYVLASADWLEREDITAFPLFTGTQLIPSVQYTEAVVPPKHDRRSDWWILSRLLQALNVPSQLDEPDHRDGFKFLDMALATQGLSIEEIKARPYQTALIKQEPKDLVYQTCLLHEDAKIDCYPEYFVKYGLFDRCEQIWSELLNEPENVLKLISMRTPHMHNSWMANVPGLRGGNLAENRLRMCPSDASSRGLLDGERIRVSNENGELECRLEVRDDLRPGTVAMSHGYGHQQAGKLEIASSRPGANCNQLMPIGANTYEPLSHMSWLCGVPVTVERIA